MQIDARQARIDQHRGFILAMKALDDPLCPPPELCAGSTGQSQAARGVRFLQTPQCLAPSRSRNKPARSMARLMVMTVGLLVDAALEERIRTALKEHEATLPE
jgi:hypothetical protein